MYTTKNISIAFLIGTAFFASSSLAYYLEVKAIEGDIVRTGAFELYEPLWYAAAGTFVFILVTTLSFSSRNFRLVGVLGIIASVITWGFYASQFAQFGGWIFFLVFSPYFVVFYAIPTLFLITLSFLSIRLLVSKMNIAT